MTLDTLKTLPLIFIPGDNPEDPEDHNSPVAGIRTICEDPGTLAKIVYVAISGGDFGAALGDENASAEPGAGGGYRGIFIPADDQAREYSFPNGVDLSTLYLSFAAGAVASVSYV